MLCYERQAISGHNLQYGFTNFVWFLLNSTYVRYVARIVSRVILCKLTNSKLNTDLITDLRSWIKVFQTVTLCRINKRRYKRIYNIISRRRGQEICDKERSSFTLVFCDERGKHFKKFNHSVQFGPNYLPLVLIWKFVRKKRYMLDCPQYNACTWLTHHRA